jgi:soluble lytic murein transglycosylase-like protein
VPPRNVARLALYEQRLYRRLIVNRRLARLTIDRLPRPLTREARDNLVAGKLIASLAEPRPLSAIRTAAPRPAVALLRYYQEAQRRFRVGWHVLAAVNFVESAFGKLRNASAAGARGPMQFLPSTWRRYGLGGDIDDPHDAILGAANYLHASGAPHDYRRALYAYNHSPAYVGAILRYARRMALDRRAYFAYYSWQVFVRTPSGVRRVTAFGLGSGT